MDGRKLLPSFACKARGRHGLLIRSVAACVVAAVMASPARAETLTFADAAIGAPPENFEFGRTGQGSAGQWIVVQDATAEGGRALEQTSAEATDYRFPLAIYRPVTAKNIEVSVRFK